MFPSCSALLSDARGLTCSSAPVLLGRIQDGILFISGLMIVGLLNPKDVSPTVRRRLWMSLSGVVRPSVELMSASKELHMEDDNDIVSATHDKNRFHAKHFKTVPGVFHSGGRLQQGVFMPS